MMVFYRTAFAALWLLSECLGFAHSDLPNVTGKVAAGFLACEYDGENTPGAVCDLASPSTTTAIPNTPTDSNPPTLAYHADTGPTFIKNDGFFAAEGTQGLRSLMTADEAARYDAYWAQELSGPTRQRLQIAPGTQSITDVKLSTQTGQPYARQTIYDEYGRATGVNDFTTHGRPQAHADPHYHTIDSQNWNGGVPHGPATPGLHPDTP